MVANASYAQETELDDAQIQELVNRVLESQDYSVEELQSFAKTAETAVLARPEPRDRVLVVRACLAVGRSYYLAGEINRALKKLGECVNESANALAKTDYYRLRAFRAVLLLSAGQPKDSLEALAVLVAESAEGVEPVERLRVQTYYAGALGENGQTLAAHDQYQDALLEALESGLDGLVLGIANNYIVSLLDQAQARTASQVLEAVSPIIAEAPSGFVKYSLQLHQLQVIHKLGEPERAVTGLRDYIATHPLERPYFIGSAYEYLADALRDLGDLDAALVAGKQAIALLQESPLEILDARFSIAETLLALSQPRLALEQLDKASNAAVRTDTRAARWHRLSVRALLDIGDLSTARKRFAELIETENRLASRSSEESQRYYEAKLTTQRQQAEIERIESSRIAMAAQVEMNNQRANTLEQLSERSRQMRYIVLFTIAALLIAAMCLLYLATQRRFERQLREKEVELNQSLSLQVDEKSAALVAQLEEQNRLERTLARTAQAEAIGQLTGNVAHDFNNLMQVVRVGNEQLDTNALSESQRSFLHGSNNALDHAASMIRQLLAFARRQTLEIEVLTFAELLDDSGPLFDTAVGRSITLETIDRTEGRAVRVDRSQLVTIVLNLLTNSRDSMPDGGVIQLRASYKPIDGGERDFWSHVPSGDYLLLEVTDQGSGMTDIATERAFEPFFTTKGEQAGTGLGLSSAKGFARQSGGDVSLLETGPGGTCIGLLLPCSEDGSTGSNKKAGIPSRLDAMRILLVEDNLSLAATLSAMLQHLGATVVHVSSADKAIEALSVSHSFDAVLSDIRMPGVHDGFDLHDWATTNCPGLTLVLMTGYSDSDRQRDSIRMINKPFSSEQLVAALVAARPTHV